MKLFITLYDFALSCTSSTPKRKHTNQNQLHLRAGVHFAELKIIHCNKMKKSI